MYIFFQQNSYMYAREKEGNVFLGYCLGISYPSKIGGRRLCERLLDSIDESYDASTAFFPTVSAAEIHLLEI